MKQNMTPYSIEKDRREEKEESLHLRKRRVNRNSLVESPKCSTNFKMRHQNTIRKERLELPLHFRKKLRNPKERKKMK
jgi:hypothetical protein